MQVSAAGEASERDSDIVECLQQGAPQQAFELLVNRYDGKIYRLCCSLLRDPSAAEDAAQESLLRIWKALPTFDGRAALSTWMYTITRNRCFTAIERRRDMDSLADPVAEQAAEAMQGTTGAVEPEDHLVLLRELVDGLPERYRRVLTLFYYEECSVVEVAAMLGIPEGTVKTTLFRARGLLMAQLQQLGMADLGFWLESAT